MTTGADLNEYLDEIRLQVCSRCIERPPEGPPCAPHAKGCGVELHLAKLVELCHRADSARIDPYVDSFHDEICTLCENRDSKDCPCPLEYLLPLAVAAIETVDRRRAEREDSE